MFHVMRKKEIGGKRPPQTTYSNFLFCPTNRLNLKYIHFTLKNNTYHIIHHKCIAIVLFLFCISFFSITGRETCTHKISLILLVIGLQYSDHQHSCSSQHLLSGHSPAKHFTCGLTVVHVEWPAGNDRSMARCERVLCN